MQGEAYEKTQEDDITDLRTDVQYGQDERTDPYGQFGDRQLSQGFCEAGKAKEVAINNEKEVKKLRKQVDSLEKLNSHLKSKIEIQSKFIIAVWIGKSTNTIV